MRSILDDEGQRKVFAAGIVNASQQWAGKVPEEFLCSQRSLDILFKDGFTFFSVRKEQLKSRFRQAGQKTRILVLHPDYQHMAAVAEMDPMKVLPQNQIVECRFAIQTIQDVRSELLLEGIDIKDRVQVLGYKLVPTWTGFLGDSLAFVNLFFTRPHRGDLPMLVLKKEASKANHGSFYDAYETEFSELWRHTERAKGESLFDFDLKGTAKPQ